MGYLSIGYILLVGATGGLFAAWILRLGKVFHNFYEKKVNEKWRISLTLMTDFIVLLIFALILLLVASFLDFIF